MSTSLRNSVCIAGCVEAPIGKTGLSTLELMAKATRELLAKVDLKPSDIDATLSGISAVDPYMNPLMFLHFEEYFGLHTRTSSTISCGGATAIAMVEAAAGLIQSGQAERVLCVCGDNWISFATTGSGFPPETIENMSKMTSHPEFEFPYGMFTVVPYALIAQRLMAEFGTTAEQLASVAVNARTWAGLNPSAVYRKPLSVDDVLMSPVVASPYHVLECPPLVDGGGAFLVTSADTADQYTDKPVYVAGLSLSFEFLDVTQAASLARSRAIRESGERAFAMAGIRPSDVDVFESYDAFTATPIIQLEELGFVGPGEGGAFVQEGNTLPGGSLPMSTHGGILSQGHPGEAAGLLAMIEAVQQLRGDCGDRQVPDCEVAVHSGVIGVSGGAGTIAFTKEPE
jgi:acetyl-CoA acetyltransferase